MIVWGGRGATPTLGTGGRYDPVADTWQALPSTDAPAARFDHQAIWTGDEMIVWGGTLDGVTATDTGARYHAAADQWGPMSMKDAPLGRYRHTAIWTGRWMVVWGGGCGTFCSTNTGARYDPRSDAWQALPVDGAPSRRFYHTAVWTGEEMIVWDGFGTGTGGRYLVVDPPDVDGDGFTRCTGDCDDSDPSTHAGAEEVCDGKDNDCDGSLPASETDGDAAGFRICGGDCDDASGAMNPAAVELPGNAVDENCDGALACSSAASWRTHGQFVSCVARECGTLIESGAVTEKTCEALVAWAARSLVGTSRGRQASREPNMP